MRKFDKLSPESQAKVRKVPVAAIAHGFISSAFAWTV